VPSIRFEAAGFPDYLWMFATDQEYTVFALLAAGQFTTAMDGLRSLAQVSIIANHDSGKVVHETVTDGSVYFGLNDEPGDIDETAKFPNAGLLEVLPSVPSGQSSVSGTNIRVGTGSVDVAAEHHGSSWTTTVTARLACTLQVGATLPGGARVHLVTLNGFPVRYSLRDTNAGREVLVSTPCSGRTWQVHIVAS
jgi:hypothetical protein